MFRKLRFQMVYDPSLPSGLCHVVIATPTLQQLLLWRWRPGRSVEPEPEPNGPQTACVHKCIHVRNNAFQDSATVFLFPDQSGHIIALPFLYNQASEYVHIIQFFSPTIFIRTLSMLFFFLPRANRRLRLNRPTQPCLRADLVSKYPTIFFGFLQTQTSINNIFPRPFCDRTGPTGVASAV